MVRTYLPEVAPSDCLNPQASADGIGDVADMRGIRGGNSVVASNCSFDDRHVDDVVMSRTRGQRSDGLGLLLGEGFGGAQGEEAGQARLAGSAAPRFGEHRRRHGGGHLEREEAGVKCPHSSVVMVGGDQRASVVGDAVHSGALARWLTAEHRPRSGEPFGELVGGEGAVPAFPFGDTFAAGIDPEAVCGSVRDPRADRGAFRCSGEVDGVGELGG